MLIAYISNAILISNVISLLLYFCRPNWDTCSELGCPNCPGGQYCPYLNMTSSTMDCNAGYYCTGGSPVADPVGETYGDECPTGN